MITLAVLVPVSVLFLALALQHLVPVSVLLRDPNATAYDAQNQVMFYRGTISNLGILLWWAAASVYAFAAYLYRSRFGRATSSLTHAFLVYMAALTGLLALDDLFMIHEELLPVRLGVPEVSMYVLYGVPGGGTDPVCSCAAGDRLLGARAGARLFRALDGNGYGLLSHFGQPAQRGFSAR